ncbi:MAG: methyltransferase domain-containing protein [bacterium]|nr:methyltransferase domain-containing protein [bacterium]
MSATTSQVRHDFDRIALLGRGEWDHNAYYHAYLLDRLPAAIGPTLDLGCGTGEFSRQLASRAEHVLGIDLSPNMIDVARSRSAGLDNVEYRIGDALEWPVPTQSFDCVASIATLHHLPFAETLQDLADALRPGGTLIVLDLIDDASLVERCLGAIALPVARWARFRATGSLRESAEARRLWAEHGRGDTYPRLKDVRRTCADILPGAEVRRHLLWRYSIVWRKPHGGVAR